ncbi:hypothetical protein CC86DRAFT_387374 [Ophiobolus disseminans]|uniref:Uncharacterized protein n=1 Tax=Ophiobolus disseminans TaxID=1469910 RepID=A0A6A6ZJ62_9PLEO|nr:hypothetical protein CC86DRAFT_387374 [Ophiobolus disseminans]
MPQVLLPPRMYPAWFKSDGPRRGTYPNDRTELFRPSPELSLLDAPDSMEEIQATQLRHNEFMQQQNVDEDKVIAAWRTAMRNGRLVQAYVNSNLLRRAQGAEFDFEVEVESWSDFIRSETRYGLAAYANVQVRLEACLAHIEIIRPHFQDASRLDRIVALIHRDLQQVHDDPYMIDDYLDWVEEYEKKLVDCKNPIR